MEKVASVWYKEPHQQNRGADDGGIGGTGGRAWQRRQFGLKASSERNRRSACPQPYPCGIRSFAAGRARGRFRGNDRVRTTFSCQTANIVLYLFLCEFRDPIPNLSYHIASRGGSSGIRRATRLRKGPSVKSGRRPPQSRCFDARDCRAARVFRLSGCGKSFARSSMSVCRSPRPNSSRFKSAASTRRCS